MLYIQHRKNSLQDLQSASTDYGIEVDVRADINTSGRLVTAHDPFTAQEDFDIWLKTYAKNKFAGPLIINTKADLLENYLFTALKKHNISNFLFLDTAIPTLVKQSQTELAPHFMLRISSYESLDACFPFKGKIPWLWVDCFSGIPMDLHILEKAAQIFKLCLVSPELHGFDLKAHIGNFLPLISYASAICTKDIKTWKAQRTT